MNNSPPRKLYNTTYYETNCEGHNCTIENLSPRLKYFETWIAPQINGTILDLGFGRGELSILSAKLPKVNKVISIDYSYDASIIFINALKNETIENQDKIIQICGDIDDFFQYLNIQFSYIIAFDIIEHMYKGQVKHFFNQLSSKIISGGKIFIMTPLSQTPPNDYHVWLPRDPDDLFILISQNCFICKHIGPSGSGEDHMFEIIRK